MNLFLLNLLLALTWAALSGAFTPWTLVTGFVLGYVALWFAHVSTGRRCSYARRVVLCLRLIFYFFWELLLSSTRVAADVLRPQPRMRPGIVKMPLDARSDFELLLVANLISLTPGTLTLDVAEDRSYLLVHAMFADDPAAVVAELKSGMERMVREVFEP